ncbi:MAG TPA: hypothetical protein VF058_01080 [Actinomycetota bacterium]
MSREFIEGVLIVVSGFVVFGGSVWLLLAAILGVRMGYLVAATGFFAFLLILSALWTFGAPIPGGEVPAYLGPKGELPHWVPVGAGVQLTSETFPEIERFPGGPWDDPADDPAFADEVEPATGAFQEFLAERAAEELGRQGIEGEVAPEAFEVEQLRFATAEDGTELAAARAFATTGGPEVVALAYKNEGNEPLPSWLFLGASVIGLAVHLPFLDRAERRRKEFLTGGDQAPWRGPA